MVHYFGSFQRRLKVCCCCVWMLLYVFLVVCDRNFCSFLAVLDPNRIFVVVIVIAVVVAASSSVQYNITLFRCNCVIPLGLTMLLLFVQPPFWSTDCLGVGVAFDRDFLIAFVGLIAQNEDNDNDNDNVVIIASRFLFILLCYNCFASSFIVVIIHRPHCRTPTHPILHSITRSMTNNDNIAACYDPHNRRTRWGWQCQTCQPQSQPRSIDSYLAGGRGYLWYNVDHLIITVLFPPSNANTYSTRNAWTNPSRLFFMGGLILSSMTIIFGILTLQCSRVRLFSLTNEHPSSSTAHSRCFFAVDLSSIGSSTSLFSLSCNLAGLYSHPSALLRLRSDPYIHSHTTINHYL